MDRVAKKRGRNEGLLWVGLFLTFPRGVIYDLAQCIYIYVYSTPGSHEPPNTTIA